MLLGSEDVQATADKHAYEKRKGETCKPIFLGPFCKTAILSKLLTREINLEDVYIGVDNLDLWEFDCALN